MQIEDAISPTYSTNSNALKLNSSSVVFSTPGCETVQGPVVFFEEFAQSHTQRNSLKGALPKKRLTIQIGQKYQFEQHPQMLHDNPAKNKNEESSTDAPKVQCEQPKAQQFTSQFKGQGQQVQSWKASCQALEKEKERLQSDLEVMEQTLRKKEEMLIVQQQKNQEMALRIGQLQEVAIQDKFYDQKLREKEGKYRELQKIQEKVVAMNKSLQRELRESEKKIMELQREVQKNVCTTQYENLAKIKESSSKMKESSLKLLNPLSTFNREKENTQSNVKSVDKKKPSSASQIKKTGKITTSTTNFSKKLQNKNALI